ncbi:bifunctional phosphopantothenoylcysteine decarboxylase/phosphopantothenate--cysteine ligase CoaBC [Limosilactobacillus portuensis]|jgi:phosphopantothenoylcysteine decarboxylase/phosphopantothenate--cysteine ligase|uniref:Coenzyme A biosynthesis bifunctional protein CoaBC n=1 Tax=Limosilactobacillus portuensis TaxID=2742601 RepID=A0ABS6IWQ0_9LACO|nr:bifunctional phosphopantothenoylcysteine decarboxylase/phosphopantothenate--cysteine ligase CoaBC [Limosilactobacillus portuensis]MBU9695944.1 bifunctional phosphopantothenoylcysteine decarboxylase/phosphopantothenate--cysteine ligase CoaBC [Limosilactobacillus portuensis]MDU1506192.1 bifunctional phosphopantothenoylcysteine decarboxylase/phosphopantothenate--cysteine ligase CoaBC [Limosilactobacillus vaginalis]PMC26844.1 bifunctional phosphopantothenoylcysteine decarboxylase/phosphopantothen
MAKIAVYMTGGIALYKGIEVIRALERDGHQVRVAMTESATNLVTPSTLHALTHYPVLTTLWNDNNSPVPHIELADWSDYAIVLPATANIIGKMANGIADDAVSTTLLATAVPKVVVPAMNSNMWNNPAVQRNVAQLRIDGVTVIEPAVGMLAEGYRGKGRLPEPSEIISQLRSIINGSTRGSLRGKKVLITAGGTREAIDPVRFIGNRSSGKMGIAIAKAAADVGATVELVLGQISVPQPVHPRISIYRVESTEEMQTKVTELFPSADILIMAAAVADFRPAQVANQKIKKQDDQEQLELQLVKTTDILKTVAEKKRAEQLVVGFAAETADLIQNANKKLRSKNADIIIANSVAGDNGAFGSDLNQVTILQLGTEPVQWSKMKKIEVAIKLIQLLATKMK